MYKRQPSSDSLSLRLRDSSPLTSLHTLSPRIILNRHAATRIKRATTFCRLMVSDLFHSPPGVLFTFPSRYWYAIGDQEYLALEGGPPDFPQGFTCPMVLRICLRSPIPFAYRAVTVFGGPFQSPSTRNGVCNFFRLIEAAHETSCNPAATLALTPYGHCGLGYSPFVRHY